jgi:hypothetical protein
MPPLALDKVAKDVKRAIGIVCHDSVAAPRESLESDQVFWQMSIDIEKEANAVYRYFHS